MSTTVHLSLGADGRTYSVKPFSLNALDELKEALTPILAEFDRSIEAMPEEPDINLFPGAYRDHMRQVHELQDSTMDRVKIILEREELWVPFKDAIFKNLLKEGDPNSINMTCRSWFREFDDYGEAARALLNMGGVAGNDQTPMPNTELHLTQLKSKSAYSYGDLEELFLESEHTGKVRSDDRDMDKLMHQIECYLQTYSRVVWVSVRDESAVELSQWQAICGGFLVFNYHPAFNKLREILTKAAKQIGNSKPGDKPQSFSLSSKATMVEFPAHVDMRDGNGKPQPEKYDSYMYQRFLCVLRNLGRANVTGSFTETNLLQALKPNKSLREAWVSFALKCGDDRAGWTSMEEHEKIRMFLEQLRDKVKPRQFLAMAEQDFEALDHKSSGLSVTDFIDLFTQKADMLQKVSELAGDVDSRVADEKSRIRQLRRVLVPSCVKYIKEFCRQKARAIGNKLYDAGYPLSMMEFIGICADWAEDNEQDVFLRCQISQLTWARASPN